MPYKYERLYGVPATCNFVLWNTDGVDINATASCVLGDITISQDFAACANATNLFSAHADGMGHRVVFTSSEMATSQILARITDQDSTKEWLDEVIIIETYGNENSQHNRRDPGVILETIIDSVSGNAEFIIVDQPNDNNTLLNSVAMIIDTTGENAVPDRSFRNVTSYTGSTGRVELASDTDFTLAAGDRVVFLPTADIDSATEIAAEVWGASRSAHGSAGTFGEGVIVHDYTASGKDEFIDHVTSALSAFEVATDNNFPVNFTSMLIDSSGKTTIGTNEDKTGYTLTTAAYVSAAEVALTHDWTQISGSAAPRSTWNALRFLRNRWEVNGSALTVYKENDTSAAWTSDLSSTSSADRVIGSDPA